MSKTKNLFKILSFLLVALLSFSLIACGKSDADIAKKVDDLIVALPADVTLDDELVLINARDAYEELTAEQKKLVSKLEELVAKENKYADLVAAGAVILKIDNLPANLVIAHKALVAGARTAYDALTSAQKVLVLNYAKLQTAEATMVNLEKAKADQDAASNVEGKITALPIVGVLKLSDKAAVVAARTAYDGLTAAQKALVTNLSKLTNSEEEIVRLEAVEKENADKAAALVVDDQIGALPQMVILSDKPAIEAARAAYAALTEAQKVFVVNLVVLEQKEARIVKLELAKPVLDQIALLPEEVTTSDEAAIVAARTAYDALAEDIKALVTNLEYLVLKEEQLIIVKNPDLGAIYAVLKTLPRQIVDDFDFPTADGTIEWSYKENSNTSYFNLETGEIAQNIFGEAKSILVAKRGQESVEVEINFGLLYEGQTPIFYTGATAPAGGKASDGFGTYYTQLEKAGFNGVMVTVGDKVYFLSKNAYVAISGTEENEKISREALRPYGLSTQADYNNTGLNNGKPTGYAGAGVLYYNSGTVAVTFDASDTYGRGNNPSLGFGKMVIKVINGELVVQPVLATHADNDSIGSTGLLTVTLNPGEYFWTVHSWEVDYSNIGYGTNLNQNHNGVLAPETVIKITKFKDFTPKDADAVAIELLKAKIPSVIVNDFTLPTLANLVWSLKEGEDDTIYDIATGKLLKLVHERTQVVLIATYKEVEYEVVLNFGIANPALTQFYYNASSSMAALTGGTVETQTQTAGFNGYSIIIGGNQYFLGQLGYISLTGETENQEFSKDSLRPYGLGSGDQLYNNAPVTGGIISPSQRGYGVLYENTGTVPIKFDLSNTYGRNNSASYGYGKVVFVPKGNGTYEVLAYCADTGTNTTTTTTTETMFVLNPGEMLWCPHTWETGGTGLNQTGANKTTGSLTIGAIIKVVKYKIDFSVPTV